jgi:hypothetical protein
MMELVREEVSSDEWEFMLAKQLVDSEKRNNMINLLNRKITFPARQ